MFQPMDLLSEIALTAINAEAGQIREIYLVFSNEHVYQQCIQQAERFHFESSSHAKLSDDKSDDLMKSSRKQIRYVNRYNRIDIVDKDVRRYHT
jgi:hypothetical protein